MAPSFVLLPIAEFWSAVVLQPDQLDPRRWQFDLGYLGQFPPGVQLVSAFFIACAIYGFVLNRADGTVRSLTNGWSDRER